MDQQSNHSHFIRTLVSRYGIDLEELWKDTMRNKDPYSQERAFDDRVEEQFWVERSKHYDQQPSLYDYAPHVFDRILHYTGKDKTMIEIGCGTGKFTMPMLAMANYVHAIDFSKDMLLMLKDKLSAEARGKVSLIQGKWEECTAPEVDCIYSINALYRMREIKKALIKMNQTARSQVVLVWTMQRSVFDVFINRFHKTGLERNQEYIHLIGLLYELGIDPGLEFIKVNKPVTMTRQKAREQLSLLATRYDLPKQQLLDIFHEAAKVRGNDYFYKCPLKVALIHWTPSSL